MNRVKLGDFIEQYGDGIHGTPNYDDNGMYYFVNGNNLINGRIQITDETLKVTEEEYEKIKRPLSDNTLLLSINGTLGRVAVYNGEKIALGKQYKKYIAEISNAELEHTYDEIYQMCLLAFMQLEHADRKDWLDEIKNNINNVK